MKSLHFIPSWVTCPDCRGYVQHINMAGEVNDGCRACGDTGRIHRRDGRGRFVGNTCQKPDIERRP